MNTMIASAMGRALKETRAGNLVEATRVIQSAVNHGEAGKVVPSVIASNAPRPQTKASLRQPLGETVRALASMKSLPAFRQSAGQRRANSGPDVPAGALYETRSHRSAFGSRNYRIFVPSIRSEPVQGLVVMLHGCTQTADDFATGTRMNDHAERQNFILIYPEQDGSENQMFCWNWFLTANQQRDAGEPAILADLAASVGAEFGVPDEWVFAAGLSAGGAMAAILGRTYPDVFAAVGVHSGLAHGSAHDVATAFAAMRDPRTLRASFTSSPVPTIVFHGTADTTVHSANADNVLAAALTGEVGIEIIAPANTLPSGVTRRIYTTDDGRPRAEAWLLDGVGHAWSGGSPDGSYTHAHGPDASAEMIRFFLSVATENAK